MRRFAPPFFLACVLALALACEQDANVTALDLTPSLAVEKVEVCHLNDEGVFQIITVADPALPHHLDHGDAQPGEPVPGMAGYVFDDLCQPVATAVCPCFDDAALDGIDWVAQVCTQFVNFPGSNVWLHAYDQDRHVSAGAYAYGARATDPPQIGGCSLLGSGPSTWGLTLEERQACEAVVSRKAAELGFPDLQGTNHHLLSGSVTPGACFSS